MGSDSRHAGISRRTLLIGGGAGVGLLVAWGLWPREYPPNLRAAPGETLYNAFLKIGSDGRVIVAVPQAEIGQGVYTSLPQILADELGADWRTVAVEPAPIHPLYANRLLAEERSDGRPLTAFRGVARWAAGEYATRTALMMTGGSTSVRSFEPRLREAGATARALLMKTAAERWDADWETLDTVGGFVIDGPRRLSFAELAEEAAGFDAPDNPPMRGGAENRLVGQSLPRIDLPAKVDGSAQFAGDVRLPEMVYASVRQGPRGGGELIRIDRAAAEAVPGVMAVFKNPGWVGAAATNWWAANRAVEAMKPVFQTEGALPDSASIDAALGTALEEEDGARIFETGDIDAALEGPNGFRSQYAAGFAPNAPIETLTATARPTGDRLEVWAPTQAPGLARATAARVAGIGEGQVTIYPTLVGGGYGRKLEMLAIEQAVTMAVAMKRPVQLIWSRVEETMQDSFRAPARAELSARLAANGTIFGWKARIAAPATEAQVIARLQSGHAETEAETEASAVAGAVPPYAIPAIAVDHLPADIGVGTGIYRSGAHSYTAFFTECFIDELARRANLDPLSFRMQMLGTNPRLARCLSTAAALGGWDGGGAGSAMGLAAHSCFGSHVATMVEVEMGGARGPRVLRAVAAVDCGRVINPTIVRQLIEGGIVHGISGATGSAIRFEGGLPDARHIGDLGLPHLVDSPEVTVEIMPSEEDPGGVTELGVPTVAPAIANAVYALTGRRHRSIPFALEGAA